jgi:2-keto-4-pentenoate hydratase/2-oxohepta-3-ene-1,7-dioic acid hydratase in catechol pathway
MRICNASGRAAVVIDGRVVDAEKASGGTLPADPMALLSALDDVGELQIPDDAPALEEAALGPPLPRPGKIVAVGLNYKGHAEEQNAEIPTEPVLFAKFPSALVGPRDDIVIPAGREQVDWEVELVFAIGRSGKHIAESDAWSHVAGFTVGQDVSDREEQFRGLKQFTMAKSFDSYAPTGPVLATLDEFDDPADLAVSCTLNGELVQDSRTSDLIFTIPEIVAYTSNMCTLEAGDLFFTGTPGGVGVFRDPPRFLGDGDIVETEIEGIGSMRNACRTGR